MTLALFLTVMELPSGRATFVLNPSWNALACRRLQERHWRFTTAKLRLMRWRMAFAACRNCLHQERSDMNDIEIRDLYQELIVDHSRRPRNFGRLDHATHQAEGFNPLCGDKIRVYVNLENDVVRDLSFEGEGCAISKASA